MARGPATAPQKVMPRPDYCHPAGRIRNATTTAAVSPPSVGRASSVHPTSVMVNLFDRRSVFANVVKFLLWCILFVLCWPLALLALVIYPLVWLLLLPFRLVGIAVDGVLGLLRGVVMLPARLVGGPRA